MKKLFGTLILILLVSVFLTSCGSTVPRPKVKNGEFNFSVTYEFNGEIQIISGVYVCEYRGISWSLDGGYHRDWSGYIKGCTTEEVIMLETAEDGGEIVLNLGFDPTCFMGDSRWGNDEPLSPRITVKIVDDEGLYFQNDAKLIAETYGVRVISYEYDEPIENTFN